MKTQTILSVTVVLFVAKVSDAGSARVTEGNCESSSDRVESCIIYGPSGRKDVLVKVSHGGKILTSQAGAAWIAQNIGIRTFVRDVTYGHDQFVAVGGSYVDAPGTILTSRDGLKWTRRNSSNRVNLHAVTYGHGQFVAVGDAGTILISIDGKKWKGGCSGTSATLAAIAFGNGTFVAGGESGTLLTSTDGLKWSKQTVGDQVYVSRILFRGGHFSIVNPDASFVSSDGLAWLPQPVEAAGAHEVAVATEEPEFDYDPRLR